MMKQFILILFAVTTVAVLVACKPASKKTAEKETDVPKIKLERVVADDAPQEIKDAVYNAPDDALVGIGNAKMANFSMSRTTAATRARAEISRQLNSVVTVEKTFVDGDIQETITVQKSQSTLIGSTVIAEAEGDDGRFWTVVMMPKSAWESQLSESQPDAVGP